MLTREGGRQERAVPVSLVRGLMVWGPGLLVMLADADAGNIVTAADAGARWDYRLLPLTLLLIPMLYLVQELTVRLGIHTKRGHAELIRERFGFGWAAFAVAGLAAASIGSLVTEFTGVAGIGEMFGVSRAFTLPLAAAALLAIVGAGAYRRIERLALAVGLFELAFFAVAWTAHPGLRTMARAAIDLPLDDPGFLYMAAAIIGATFNPWMIFYQQSATVDKELKPADLAHARLDTALGAILTQCLTGAVLVAAAATLATSGSEGLGSVGTISAALTPTLGETAGRILFGAGVLGASLVAAIVASLALAWGVGEMAGYRRTLEMRPFAAGWFYASYALTTGGSAAAVWAASDLVWLNIAAQVLNVFLMPLTIGFLIALTATALPEPHRISRARFRAIIAMSALVSVAGLWGGLRGIF